MNRIIAFLLLLMGCLSAGAKEKKDSPATVIITAGQSNTDGREINSELPDEIIKNGYTYCQWSYGNGTQSGNGRFEPFWPRIVSPSNPNRFAYDAIIYYQLDQLLKAPFYVIKESKGGTAIDTACQSADQMYWCADKEYLKRNKATDKGGHSLLLALENNIDACIDGPLSRLPQGYDFKVILWHQGESDRHQGSHYYANLKAVIAHIRQHLVEKTGRRKYAHLPVVLGGVPATSRQYSPLVEEAKHRLAAEDKNIYYVDAEGATLRTDVIHFDAGGAKLLGQRVFETLIKNKIIE